MTITPAARRAAAALFAVFALLPTGCGPSVGVVTGTVTMNSAPVANATVSFVAEDGTIRSVMTGPDGTYRVDDVPIGPVKVTVQSTEALDSGAQESIKKAGKVAPKTTTKSPIAQRYADTSTSGLETTVKGGEIKYDIPLTP